MSCVNINSPEYKALVQGMDERQRFVAKTVISKFMTDNDNRLPSFIELKSSISDLYNSNKGGIDYQAFYNEVRSLFKRLIPSLTDDELNERVKFVDKLELMRLREGKEVLTTFINNTVYIANSLVQERGEQAYTDIRHEIFHTIFNNFLSPSEQEEMMSSFKRWKPKYSSIMDKEELEERMADEFEDYTVSAVRPPNIIWEFFKRIAKFFGFIGSQYNNIKKLFEDVEQGKFTRDFLKDSLVTRDKTILTKYDVFATNLDLFLQAKAFVLNNLNELMFPTESRNLSETTNASLFLNQDYKSPLFVNNKESFKLGVTKNEALKMLQARIESLNNTKNLDPELTNVIKVLSRTEILKDLFDYLQPYSLAEVTSTGELVLKNQIEEDPTEELLELDEDTPDIQIGSKEFINPITKISEVVKDFLSSITYETTPGNFVNIDPGSGFIALLNLMGSMYGNTSIEDNLQSLKNNYNSTTKGNQTKAVYNKIARLHDALISYNRLTLNIKGVSEQDLNAIRQSLDDNGIQHETFKNATRPTMTIIIPDNISINNNGTNNVDNEVFFQFNRFKEGKKSYLIRQKSNESNKTFVEKVSRETGIPNFVIAKLFNYNEQRNTLAELTKVANSLRKLSPKFVKVVNAKITDPESGESANTTSYAFIDRVSEHRSSSSISGYMIDRLDILDIRQDVIRLVDNYQSIKSKGDKKQIRNLLKNIVVDTLGVISSPDFQMISDRDVSILLNNFERILTFTSDIRTNKPSEEFSNSDQYLRQTSSLARLITKYTFEKNNPTSFSVSTSNKQKWENVMKNTSYMIFKNLEDFALGVIKSDRLLPYLRNSFNNYLRFNPIFNHNYANGSTSVNQTMLKVGDNDFYADHQETYFENKNSLYTKPPVPFFKESPRDWINRNFLAMFQLPILETLTGNKNVERSNISYFQQKFQPESAPNVSVVKMGIHTAEKLQESFMNMILQEAYMNHLSGGSVRGNLVKNTRRSSLPGLEGSTYFLKDGVNIFFDGTGTLDPKFGTIENGVLVINKKNTTLNQLVDTILTSLESSLGDFVDMAIEEKATLSGEDIANMYTKLKNSYPKEFQLSNSELQDLKSFYVDAKTDVEALKEQENFSKQREALKKAMSIYYLNSYVNGFFMNQLSSGSTQNYKNPLDEIKRQAGVNAMNDTGLIDDKHGAKRTYKNIVISAANNFYGQTHKFAKIPLLERFFKNKKQEVGDAQSWDLPEYKIMLRKSFGKSVDIGVVTKDVHFEINEFGGVDYRKTSSAELTNTLVRQNKTLRDLRYALTFQPYLNSLTTEERAEVKPRIDYLYNKLVDQNGLRDVDEYMEYQDILQTIQDGDFMIHKASFESAVKGSKPSRMSSFVKDKETGTFNFIVDPNSILTLNSSYNGIQQAIRHRYIDSFISHFTQLTYLIGLNRTETSVKNNKAITRTLSKFAKSGIYDTLFDYRMSYKDDKTLRANLRSKKEFIKDLLKKLDLPGNERIVAMLNTPRISMNNPLFSEKLMQSFFNTLTKKTVRPKHPGGSFVLQSEFGFESNQALQENSLRTPELVIDESGNILYAEAYLPEMYSDQLKSGDLIYYNSEEYNKMFGFRIPSSDLHSSVPLRIIGYYPSVAHDNVIVIPSAVTALHGSDFDVDKLFVVRYGVFGISDEEKDPKNVDQTTEETSNKREYKTRFLSDNKTIAQKGIKFGYLAPEAEYDDKGNILNFGANDKHTQVFNIESVILEEKEKAQNRILALEKEMEEKDKVKASNKFERNQKKVERRKLTNEMVSITQHLDTLRTIQKGLYSNMILDAVLDNISYSGENAQDILFGITFDPVKGYEEESEYSQLARVFSDINKANGIDDLLAPRPVLYKTLDQALEANAQAYEKMRANLEDNLGVDTTTPDGQEDLLSLLNEDLKDNWVSDRDEFIRRQRGSGSVNINKVEQHATIHKETYMAAGLVGLIANFSKGLAYVFHGITNDANEVELEIPDNQIIKIDGEEFNSLVLENKDKIKNQELRSLVLNAAIDHVKEQILNVLNVGNKTAKIFLAAISTKMNMHQATMLMLQPVATELNSSNATTVGATLTRMQEQILIKLNDLGNPVSQEELDNIQVNTSDLEKLIQTSFTELYNDDQNPKYKKNLLLQLKVIQQLAVLERIGGEVSNVSSALSIIQDLPYNLELAYTKLSDIDKFIDVEKFYGKLKNQERSEYVQSAFRDDLRNSGNLFRNSNLGNNENVLAALEGIKVQIDVVSEMFTENSVQAQFLVNNMIKAVSNNSDPSTMFTGENDENLSFDTVSNMSIDAKYLKGRESFNLFKMISRNIFNYLTTGLNMSYNNNQHLFSLGIKNQELTTITRDNTEFQLSAVRSYLNSFLMKAGEVYSNGKYNGNNFVVSQINPAWRIKPLSLVKQQNTENKFLRGLGVSTNFRDKVRVMTYNSASVNTAENLAEVEQAFNAINQLTNVYVYQDSKGNWVDLPTNMHPETSEMSEVVFNILKASLYTDKFKFSSSKATSVIPPIYFQKIFLSLETLTKDLIYYNKSTEGNKYYKDFSDLENQTNQLSSLSNVKENLFINTIFSLPNILPNLRSILPSSKDRWKMVNRQGGILGNGNIYDLYFDANILDRSVAVETEGETTLLDPPSIDTSNIEVDNDLSESNAEQNLFERFRKNPSFIADESYNRPGNFEIYMKVGSTGSKESNDLKFYYKKIASINGQLTNNSFDLNLLLNRYQIKDYFNPKRLAIPVKNVDFSGENLTLTDVPVSSFIISASDDLRTRNQNKAKIKEAEDQQFDLLRSLPENRFKTDQQIREGIKTRVNLENVINNVSEVSVYDSRSLDRVGIRNFKIVSRTISDDKKTVTFELQALPKAQQIEYKTFDAPLEILNTINAGALTREQKIEYINSVPGARAITSAQNLTDAEIDLAYQRAQDLDESNSEINKVIKDKSCK